MIHAYTQIDHAPELAPNIWERHYSLADGRCVVLSYLTEQGGEELYGLTLHTEPPTAGKWWDNVVGEPDYYYTEAEAMDTLRRVLPKLTEQ